MAASTARPLSDRSADLPDSAGVEMRADPRLADRLKPFEHSCAVCGADLDRAHVEQSRGAFHCVFCGAPQDAVAAERTAPPECDIGNTLRGAREGKGESLAQAASATRIHERFLR